MKFVWLLDSCLAYVSLSLFTKFDCFNTDIFKFHLYKPTNAVKCTVQKSTHNTADHLASMAKGLRIR